MALTMAGSTLIDSGESDGEDKQVCQEVEERRIPRRCIAKCLVSSTTLCAERKMHDKVKARLGAPRHFPAFELHATQLAGRSLVRKWKVAERYTTRLLSCCLLAI
jgi:hypothetical protein